MMLTDPWQTSNMFDLQRLFTETGDAFAVKFLLAWQGLSIIVLLLAAFYPAVASLLLLHMNVHSAVVLDL
jgi:hypothetical protein